MQLLRALHSIGWWYHGLGPFASFVITCAFFCRKHVSKKLISSIQDVSSLILALALHACTFDLLRPACSYHRPAMLYVMILRYLGFFFRFFDFDIFESCFTFCRVLSVSSLKVIPQFALGARPFRDIERKSSSEEERSGRGCTHTHIHTHAYTTY